VSGAMTKSVIRGEPVTLWQSDRVSARRIDKIIFSKTGDSRALFYPMPVLSVLWTNYINLRIGYYI
jgi:hypothetical protein